MIRFDELLFQLKRDAFYGYAPMAELGSAAQSTNPTAVHTPAETTAAKLSGANSDRGTVEATQTRTTNAHELVSKIYADLSAAEQLQDARRAFRLNPIIKYDVHRELIYLWCSFLGLPAYRDGESLDWSWRDFIANWDEDFAFEKDELREFLRRQKLPLPAYFYFEEPDSSATIRNLPLPSPAEPGSATPPIRRKKQKAETARKSQQWQTRINELATMPEHRGKSHKALCDIVAGELIAEGHPASTIVRETVSPRNFVN